MNLGTLVVRGLAITFAGLFVYSAWSAEGAVEMLKLGGAILFLAFILGPVLKDRAWPLFAFGVAFLIGAAMIDDVQGEVKLASVVILGITILSLVIPWIRRRRNRRQVEPTRQRPRNWPDGQPEEN